MTDEPDVRTKAQLLEDFAGGQPAQIKIQNLITSIYDYIDTLGARDQTFTGAVVLSDLPTVDPEVEGQLWLDTGVLSVSTGPA